MILEPSLELRVALINALLQLRLQALVLGVEGHVLFLRLPWPCLGAVDSQAVRQAQRQLAHEVVVADRLEHGVDGRLALHDPLPVEAPPIGLGPCADGNEEVGIARGGPVNQAVHDDHEGDLLEGVVHVGLATRRACGVAVPHPYAIAVGRAVVEALHGAPRAALACEVHDRLALVDVALGHGGALDEGLLHNAAMQTGGRRVGPMPLRGGAGRL